MELYTKTESAAEFVRDFKGWGIRIGKLSALSNYFRSFKLRNKFMICFGLIIAISILNISYFAFQKTENYLDQLSSNAFQEVLRQANATLDYRMKNYERVINTFYISDEFQQVLTKRYDNKFVEYEANNRLRDFVESILNTYEYVPSVKVYNFNQSVFSGIIYKESDILDEAWKREVMEKTSTGILWSYRFSDSGDRSLSKLVAAKALRNQFNNAIYGIVSFEVNPSYMFNQLNDIDLFEGGNVYALDQTGLVVFRKDERLDDRVGGIYRLYPKLEGNSGSFKETIDGESYLVIYNKIQDAGWTLVGVKPMKVALSVTKDVREYMLRLTVLLLAVGFVVIYGMSYFFTKRLSVLTNEMFKVSKGMLNIQLDLRSNDEIGKMNNVFHMMLRKLTENMSDIAEMKMAEAELRMKALQMQISPHFLYNTLSTINWMAMSAGTTDISDAVSALAKYYRIGLSSGKEIIPIGEELEHVRSYIFIQKIRTKENIVFDISADEDALAYMTPKMVLQPIVENAIYHGIEKNRKKGTIRILVRKDGDLIRISISDDGAGIDSGKLNELAGGHAGKSYGLVNIESKIKLYFGQKCGMQIESELNRGTTVTIEMPAKSQL